MNVFELRAVLVWEQVNNVGYTCLKNLCLAHCRHLYVHGLLSMSYSKHAFNPCLFISRLFMPPTILYIMTDPVKNFTQSSVPIAALFQGLQYTTCRLSPVAIVALIWLQHYNYKLLGWPAMGGVTYIYTCSC